MNFYPHHIGDYLTATSHLTWAEDCAYRRLLDIYYSREGSLPLDVAQVCRLARAISKDERQAVQTILKEFFTETETGWSHGRCESEIVKAKASAERSKNNGMRGGRPVKAKPTDNPVGCLQETHQVILGLQKPPEKQPDPKAPNTNTNTINSVSIDTGGKPPLLTDPEEIIFGYGVPLLTNGGTPEKQARAFLGKLRNTHGDPAVVDKLRECIKAKPVQPLTWLAAALPPGGTTASPQKRTGTHSGFDKLNYSEGVNADGTFV